MIESVETKYTKEDMLKMLDRGRPVVERAIVAIYRKQTDVEKSSQMTIEYNGIGFNGFDAGIMSSFAEWILGGKHLSNKQLAVASKKIRKYAGQLAKISNKEI